MGEFLSSILKRIQNRASTTLFAVYSSFWAILHAEGIITLLFTDQNYIYEKYGMLKNEYLFKYFFGLTGNPWGFVLRQLLAIGFTALYARFFARYILNPIYKIEIKYKYDRRIEKAKQERRLLDEKAQLTRAKARKAQEDLALEKARIEAERSKPEKQWAKDYEELIKKGGTNVIESLIRIYYDHSGLIKDAYAGYNARKEDVLSCEALGLFERNPKNTNYLIPTNKGWFFIKKYKNLL